MLLAKHAQHVVLIHFPIALFIIAVAFDLLAYRLRRQDYAAVAYYNLAAAAIFAVPTVLTGLLARELLMEHHRLKGILLYHLLAAFGSAAVILLSWWIHYQARQHPSTPPVGWRIPLEFAGVLLLVLTGHLGGFLSGVNIAP